MNNEDIMLNEISDVRKLIAMVSLNFSTLYDAVKSRLDNQEKWLDALEYRVANLENASEESEDECSEDEGSCMWLQPLPFFSWEGNFAPVDVLRQIKSILDLEVRNKALTTETIKFINQAIKEPKEKDEEEFSSTEDEDDECSEDDYNDYLEALREHVAVHKEWAQAELEKAKSRDEAPLHPRDILRDEFLKMSEYYVNNKAWKDEVLDAIEKYLKDWPLTQLGSDRITWLIYKFIKGEVNCPPSLLKIITGKDAKFWEDAYRRYEKWERMNER